MIAPRQCAVLCARGAKTGLLGGISTPGPVTADPMRTGAGLGDPTSRGWLTNGQRPRQRGPDSIMLRSLIDVRGVIKNECELARCDRLSQLIFFF